MKVEQLKKWYEQGKWSKARLKMVVKAGTLSEDEYKMITGEDYKTDNKV